ncbi:MAG: biotin synthase [Candidatus Aminicenantes bacterium]|nr:biotin synthase [Candidatus Aminicenantes bacterium]
MRRRESCGLVSSPIRSLLMGLFISRRIAAITAVSVRPASRTEAKRATGKPAEDPLYFGRGGGFESLIDLTEEIKEETGLPVMISPGVVPDYTLGGLARAGVDWYACYQETHNRRLFEEMRPGQNYEERMNRKFLARKLGLLVEEGIMTGVGETLEDIADSMAAMRLLGAHQVRVMSFNPQEGTPMAGRRSPLRLRELLIIAVMRLVFPDRLIPASLDIDGRGYLKERLDAGANVITSLIPPALGFAGVSQALLDINEGNRTPGGIRPILNAAGLHLAGADEYKNWVREERTKLRPKDLCTEARL